MVQKQNRVGIILAGGAGSRLHPITKACSKQLLPIYNKPMVYYPLSTLLLAGIRDILIISTPEDLHKFVNLFGTGEELGLNIQYKEQPKPEGIAQAFILGEDFINGRKSALILGDNLFYSNDFVKKLRIASDNDYATIFVYEVSDPKRYGVAEFDKKNNVLSIEEKPRKPKSNFAVTGLYFYDEDVCRYAKSLKPSARGELEITDLNNIYLKKGFLNASVLSRGSAWLDTGTYESLMQAGIFVQTIEERTGLKIGCIEEVCYYNKFITKDGLRKIVDRMADNQYKEYLLKVLKYD